MKKDFPLAIAAAIVILGVCFGLAAVRPNLPPRPSTPFSATGPPAATPAKAANDRVVMHVNGEPVTESEFNAFLQQAPAEMQTFYSSPDGRRLLAQEIVKFKALEQEGHRLGVDKDPLAASRIAMSRANIIAAFALQKLVPKPDDARLRAEYEKEKRNLDTIQLSHILIAYQGGSVPPRNGAPLSYGEAVRKANAIAAQLRGGADFAQMARSESDDTGSAANGGSLGPVSPASLPQELQGAVASLKEGQIGKPTRSSFGVHIFKSGAHQGRGFEELKPMFAAKVQRDDAEAMVGRLQRSAKVELDPKFFPPQSAIPQPIPQRGRP